MKFRRTRPFAVTLCFVFTWMLAGRLLAAQDVRVLVLDALSGKPEANVKVDYLCTRPQLNRPGKGALTNSEGLATLTNPCHKDEEIEIAIYPPGKKEQCGVGPVTLAQILSVGAVAKPDADGGLWCPTKVSRRIKPLPGQVVMFVKRPTWWQSHVAG